MVRLSAAAYGLVMALIPGVAHSQTCDKAQMLINICDDVQGWYQREMPSADDFPATMQEIRAKCPGDLANSIISRGMAMSLNLKREIRKTRANGGVVAVQDHEAMCEREADALAPDLR
jgi:hypothetical protein